MTSRELQTTVRVNWDPNSPEGTSGGCTRVKPLGRPFEWFIEDLSGVSSFLEV